MPSFIRDPLILRSFLALAWILFSGIATAAPGAHGPNGEHLDAPSSAAAGPNASEQPKFEAQSDLFEVVGTLNAGELQIFINRFATNEPVLDAAVEVETGGLKATAVFHADLGDYAAADEAFLEALRTEGDHAIILTIIAGGDADLLDTNLHVGAHDGGHDHDTGLTTWLLIGVGIAAVVGLALFAMFRARPSRLQEGAR